MHTHFPCSSAYFPQVRQAVFPMHHAPAMLLWPCKEGHAQWQLPGGARFGTGRLALAPAGVVLALLLFGHACCWVCSPSPCKKSLGCYLCWACALASGGRHWHAAERVQGSRAPVAAPGVACMSKAHAARLACLPAAAPAAAQAAEPLPTLPRALTGWAKRWRAWRDSPFRWATNQAAADADRALWHVGSVVLLSLLVLRTAAKERLWGECQLGVVNRQSSGVVVSRDAIRRLALSCRLPAEQPNALSQLPRPHHPCFPNRCGPAQCHTPAGAAGPGPHDLPPTRRLCALSRAVGAGCNRPPGVDPVDQRCAAWGTA